jgi:hypothetical protein
VAASSRQRRAKGSASARRPTPWLPGIVGRHAMADDNNSEVSWPGVLGDRNLVFVRGDRPWHEKRRITFEYIEAIFE